MKFTNKLLHILDDMGGMKGSCLIMDNCSIHNSKLMQNKTLRRDDKFMYLPTYSSEMNAVEQFWSLIKGKMKRDKLLGIKDACEQVLLSDLYGFANHSKHQTSNCYDKIPFLTFSKYALFQEIISTEANNNRIEHGQKSFFCRIRQHN